MSEENIAENIFNTLKNKLSDGDIIFARQGKTLIHAAIWSQNPDNVKQNFMHVAFRGLVYSDLKDFVKNFFLKDVTLEIFTLEHGKAIAEQAKRWINSGSIFKINDEDIYVSYNHYLRLASYILIHAESLKVGSEKIKEFIQAYKLLSNENVAFLEYCKYATRRSMKPSRNAGLTCASFILLCVTLPLISDKIPEFKGDGLPPALKQGRQAQLPPGLPHKYVEAINLLNILKPKLPGPEVLLDALKLGLPAGMKTDNILFVEELKKAENYQRIPVRTYQNKKGAQDKAQRQSVIEFLAAKGIKLEKLHADIQAHFHGLLSLNPKIVNLDPLYHGLRQFHNQTNPSLPIQEISLRSSQSLQLQSPSSSNAGLFHKKELKEQQGKPSSQSPMMRSKL